MTANILSSPTPTTAHPLGRNNGYAGDIWPNYICGTGDCPRALYDCPAYRPAKLRETEILFVRGRRPRPTRQDRGRRQPAQKARASLAYKELGGA